MCELTNKWMEKKIMVLTNRLTWFYAVSIRCALASDFPAKHVHFDIFLSHEKPIRIYRLNRPHVVQLIFIWVFGSILFRLAQWLSEKEAAENTHTHTSKWTVENNECDKEKGYDIQLTEQCPWSCKSVKCAQQCERIVWLTNILIRLMITTYKQQTQK